MTQPVVVVCLLGLREPHALPRGESDGNDISDLDPLANDPACENLRKREGRRNFIVLFFLVYVARPVVVTAVIYFLYRHASWISLLAFRRKFVALVFFVYVTRPVVLAAGVYDERSIYIYSFTTPCRGVLSILNF